MERTTNIIKNYRQGFNCIFITSLLDWCKGSLELKASGTSGVVAFFQLAIFRKWDGHKYVGPEMGRFMNKSSHPPQTAVISPLAPHDCAHLITLVV